MNNLVLSVCDVCELPPWKIFSQTLLKWPDERVSLLGYESGGGSDLIFVQDMYVMLYIKLTDIFYYSIIRFI